MDFQHQPLKPGEIRLLKSTTKSTELLSFKIIHVSLKSKPNYAALSYTWGRGSDTHLILLNGQAFGVRQNLHGALKRLEESKLLHKYLWVDAICINQGKQKDAEDERSVQVACMKQIYEQATKVLVWLGIPEDEDNNRLAFAMMKDCARKFRHTMLKDRPYRPWWWPRKPTPHGDTPNFLYALNPSTTFRLLGVPGSQSHKAWLVISAILKSPWWSRTWIFQESTIPESYKMLYASGLFVLKPIVSKVKFLCGGEEATWLDIGTTCIVAAMIASSKTAGIDTQFLTGASNIPAKLLTFREKRLVSAQMPFLDILQMFRHTECTDPRDKVYAPLCLAPSTVSQYIRPDYTKTVLEVYLDVVQYCLAQSRYNLDFLGHARYHEDFQIVATPTGLISILPSWVPNFSTSIEISPIPKILQREAPKVRNLRNRIHTGASGPTYRPLGDASSRSFVEGNRLYVSGVFVDQLKDIMPEDGPDSEANRAVGLERGRSWSSESNQVYFTGESWRDAYNRTCVLDIVYDILGRPSERKGKLDIAFLRKPRTVLSPVENRRQFGMSISKVRAFTLRTTGQSRKLYISMVPKTAVVGDEIWALAGGQVLYILRPVDRDTGDYRFIGECYVHGLMDGEIIKKLSRGELHMQDISLI